MRMLPSTYVSLAAHADMMLNDLQYADTAQKMLLVDLLRLLLSHVHSHVVLSSCMHSTRKEKVANTFMLEILAALLEADRKSVV